MAIKWLEHLVEVLKKAIKDESDSKYKVLKDGEPISREEFIKVTADIKRDFLMSLTMKEIRQSMRTYKMRKAEIIDRLVKIHIEYEAKQLYSDFIWLYMRIQRGEI